MKGARANGGNATAENNTRNVGVAAKSFFCNVGDIIGNDELALFSVVANESAVAHLTVSNEFGRLRQELFFGFVGFFAHS